MTAIEVADQPHLPFAVGDGEVLVVEGVRVIECLGIRRSIRKMVEVGGDFDGVLRFGVVEAYLGAAAVLVLHWRLANTKLTRIAEVERQWELDSSLVWR